MMITTREQATEVKWKKEKRIIKKTALSLMSYLNEIPNVDIQYV